MKKLTFIEWLVIFGLLALPVFAGYQTDNLTLTAVSNATYLYTNATGRIIKSTATLSGNNTGDQNLSSYAQYSFGANNFNGTGNFTTTGKLGINQTSPTADLEIASSSTSTNYFGNAIAIASTQTTVGGSTSGTAIFSQPNQGTSYKNVVVYCNALLGTVVYTFPTNFTFVPTAQGGLSALATTININNATITGATSTGFLELEGY